MQAIRSVYDRVGVSSLKEKQIEAIVLHQDTFICACATLRTTVRSTADTAITVLCSFNVGSGLHGRWPSSTYPLAHACDHSKRRCACANRGANCVFTPMITFQLPC